MTDDFKLSDNYCRRSINLNGLVLLWLSLIFACAPIFARAATVDSLPENAKIVVIGGALTEIVYALNAENQIIGRDRTSTFPKAALKLPDVGYMRMLSPEGMLSLSPQGVLLVEGSGPETTIDVVKKTAIPIVFVKESYDEEGVINKIITVGNALHKQPQAQQLANKVREKFERTHNFVARIKQKKRILFILSVTNGRILAAGKDTAADGIINLAGGVNAIDGFSGYKLLNDEAVISAAPDALLMMTYGGSSELDQQILDMPNIRLTPAGKNRMIYRMDGLYLLGFGPRTADSAYELSELLYGQRLKSPFDDRKQH